MDSAFEITEKACIFLLTAILSHGQDTRTACAHFRPGPRRKGTAIMSDDTKIEVEIFCGMTCYMLGNARILNIGAHLPEKWLPHIELMVSPCPVDCGCLDLAKAPFARINGRLIQNATLYFDCEAITEIMNRQEEA